MVYTKFVLEYKKTDLIDLLLRINEKVLWQLSVKDLISTWHCIYRSPNEPTLLLDNLLIANECI